MTHRPLLALLEDSVDKELAPEEMAELERLLESSEELRADRNRSVRLKGLLQNLPSPDPGNEYFDELKELILARTTHAAPTAVPSAVGSKEERALFTRSLFSAVASIFLFLAALFIGTRDQQSIVSLSGPDGTLMTQSVALQVDQPEFALVTSAERSRISRGMFLLSPPGLAGFLVVGLPDPVWP